MHTGPLALTPGEPAGIGPDLVIALSARARETPWVVVADPALLAARARLLGIELALHAWSDGIPARRQAGELSVLEMPLPVQPQPGHPDPDNAAALLGALDAAADRCLAGGLSGLVTGPLQKSIINEAGIAFSGHTEYLAARTGGTPVMMLAAGELRVALATTHIPLRDVAGAITHDRLEQTLRILQHDLQTRFGIEDPRIMVLGLNPHAGESGHLGCEEIEVIAPVLENLRAEGMRLEGPLPADTAMRPAKLEGCDAVLAMYHDQGLPVLKYAGFGRAVNVTLGLPLVRTSVDHGTALGLAGSGQADAGSLQAAIEMAARISHRQP